MPAARESSDVFARIERGDLDPVYVLTGEEAFLVDRCLQALRQAVLGADGAAGASFNLDSFELKDRGFGPVIDSARTLPMFAKRRMVLARGFGDQKSDDLESLLAYLGDPNPSTCLVLIAPGKLDGRMKVVQLVKKRGFLHEFPHLRDWQLADWIVAEAHRRQLSIDAEAARALASAAGPDLGRLALCLEQASLFAGPDARITSEHVEAVVPESRERSIFELTKAIGAGQRVQALRLLANLLTNREPALRIQFMLLRQLRQIWKAKELLAAGAPRPEIAGKVGLSPHFLDDVLVPARKMSTGALLRSFERLYEADRMLKSSRIDPDLQIARLISALADEAAGRAETR